MILKKAKKLLIATLILSLVTVPTTVSPAPVSEAAETTPLTITDETLFDTEYIDGLLTITGFRAPQGPTVNTIVVPAAINGQKVRAIGYQAFNVPNTDIHNLYLPDTLEVIRDDACSDYKILNIGTYTYEATGEFATVETASAESAFVETPTVETSSVAAIPSQFPSSLTKIGTKAFYKSPVQNITFNSQNLTIGSYAFAESAAGRDITVNAGTSITEIGEYAFQNSTNLHNAYINGAVGTVKKGAFQGCVAFNQFVVAQTGNISVIENEAFMNCSNLHTVTLRGTVSSIGTNAFSNCSNMNDLVIESTTPYTIGEYAFQNNTNLHNVTLSEGITTIEKGTFENCTNMNYVYLPESLEKIEEDAFKNLPNLKEITINENVTIAPDAFEGASGSTVQALANSNNAAAKALAGVVSTPAPTPYVAPVTPVTPVVTPPPVQKPKVSAVKLKKAKLNKKKKKVTLTWSKNKKASGYTVYKKVVKKGTKAKKAKKIKFKKVKNVSKKKTKLTLKVKKKTTTYFYVKAYVNVKINGKTVKVYSKASNTKKVVLK